MVFRAFATGLRTAVASAKLLALLWCVLLLAAVPFGLMMQQAIEAEIGASRVAGDLRARMDLVWLGEFHEASDGLGATLEPATTSRVDFLHNLDLLLGGRLFEQHRALVAAGVGYALCWLFLLGGLIDRYARGGGRFDLSDFLAASGRHYSRLLGLTLIAAPLYGGIFWGATRIYGAFGKAVRDVTAETTILQYYLAVAVPLLLSFALVMLVIDYAKIAAVLDEGSTLFQALRRGCRLVLRRPFTVFGLAILVTACSLGLIGLRTLTDLGSAEGSALGVLGVFLVGQLFLVGRLALRLAFVSSEVFVYRELR